MRRSSSALLAAAALLAACDLGRPDTLLICHNANCVEPTSPEEDDTLDALAASLALRHEGGPALDGIEVDSFWSAADDACLFAHDLERAERIPAIEAARAIAAHFGGDGPIAFSGEAFRVMIELKGHVGASKEAEHSPEQRTRHAACAWEMYGVLADAARARDRDVEVVFTSFEPALLRALAAAAPPSPPVGFALAAIQGIPRPFDDQTHSLADFDGIDLRYVEAHPQWLTDARREAIRSAGLELIFWTFDTPSDVFAALERDEPRMVESSEARLLRRWLD